MALGKKDIFEPSKGKKEKSKPEKKEPQEVFKRHTYYLKQSLTDKVDGYAYWERYSKSEVVNTALEEFFKDKKVKPLPEDRK